jgi:superfamily II DNA or RNA helicase
MREPLTWQREFLAHWLSTNRVDYLLAAVPASGKTFASLLPAQTFLNDRRRKLFILTPTVEIQTNWQRVAHEDFGIELQTDLESDRDLHPNFQGAVLTYAALTEFTSQFLRMMSGRYEIMGIADEIHHLTDEATWGERYRKAFEFASRRLATTGTPFRSKPHEPIPFLRVDPLTSKYIIDFPYDYPRALEDKRIRAVAFHRYDFAITLAIDGYERKLDWLDAAISAEDSDKLLNQAIFDADFVAQLLDDASRQLNHLREVTPDAGGLILCRDSDHALRTASIAESLLGERPEVIVHDRAKATTTVDAFKRSKSRWVVAVRQISEGADIPRLRVLVYLTNWTTDLFFRQAIGRVLRRRDEQELWAYGYLPNHPDLRAHARTIEQWQEHVLADRKPGDDEKRPAGPRGEGPAQVVVESEADYAGMTARGTEYDDDAAADAREISIQTGYPEAEVAAIAAILAAKQRGAQQSTPIDEPLEKRIEHLRRGREKLARKLAFLKNMDPKEVNRLMFKRYGCRVSDRTFEQLEDEIRCLRQEIADATRSA